MKRRNIIFGLCLVLLTDIAAQSAWAQNGERFRERQAARRQAAGQRREGGPAEKRQQNGRGLVGLPPKWVQNLRDMPPEEQEKFMQNNERFQSLPPWRQQQIRQNLQKWNSLSLEQQDRIRKTQQFLENATPEQRDRFENDIVPKLAQMAPERRARVLNHWRRLQALGPAEQQEALRDPAFMGNLSPEEQSVVRDLNSMGAPPPQ